MKFQPLFSYLPILIPLFNKNLLRYSNKKDKRSKLVASFIIIIIIIEEEIYFNTHIVHNFVNKIIPHQRHSFFFWNF